MLVFQIHVKMEAHAFLMNQQDHFVVTVHLAIQVVHVISVSSFTLEIPVYCMDECACACILENTVTVPPSNPCSPNPCLNGGTCQANNVGGFMCLCPAGFQGICCETREYYINIFFIFYTIFINN